MFRTEPAERKHPCAFCDQPITRGQITIRFPQLGRANSDSGHFRCVYDEITNELLEVYTKAFNLNKHRQRMHNAGYCDEAGVLTVTGVDMFSQLAAKHQLSIDNKEQMLEDEYELYWALYYCKKKS